MLGLRCDESIVTLLVLQCYGFGTVLDFFRWLVSRRESSGPSGSRVARTGRESRSTREREHADAPRLLNCPVLDPPTGGWSNQCPYDDDFGLRYLIFH